MGKRLNFKLIENYYSKYTDAIITICNEDYINAKKMHCNVVKMMHGVGVNINNFINQKVNKKEYRKKQERKHETDGKENC